MHAGRVGLDLPALVIQGGEFGCRTAVVIEQGGGEPVEAGVLGQTLTYRPLDKPTTPVNFTALRLVLSRRQGSSAGV
ncbi:hypothetical protein [Streptomyces sediminimaris]|uniref:hypothetical protein n=1 Tax=Streptomyces sediminimaris TaxID=3383721 RepID=UPI00399A274F